MNLDRTQNEEALNKAFRDADELFEMFATAGWKQVMDSFKAQLDNEKQYAHLRNDTIEKWFKHCGWVLAVEQLLGFEKQIRDLHDSLLDAKESLKAQDEVGDGEAYPL